ncbi:MAG TPA: glycosyltransferase, partial [Fibrobacteria bacterium]|nr:glycosyltransferase [Fibrobacteria bacterium]
VDNNSADGSREYLQEQKRLGRIDNLVLLDENVGVAKASNLAWSLVPNATHYLKLDNDIVLQKDGWLDEMVRVVDALPEVGVVAYSFEPISFPVVEIRGVRIRPKNGNLGGACILIPKRTEEKLGVWCEDFGIYGEEDLDYGFRVQMSGLLNAYMEDEDMGFHLPAGKAAVIDTGTWLAADGKEELVHAEYRRMKDENRARNHQSGIVEANFKAYLTGTKSVKLESGFVRARREREVGADAQMTVLVCTLNPPMNSCGYLRVVQHLRRAPSVTTLWNLGNTSDADFAKALEQSDIVLVQRGFVENRPAMDAIRASGKPWVFEIDDLLWEELPSWNPHAEEFRAIAPQLVSALREATATIASTTTLGERLEELSRDVHVVPNLLDPEIWPEVPRRQASDKLLVAYAGTATHTADLLLVEEVLERLARVHGDKLDFVFLGCVTPRLTNLPGARLVEFTDDYAAYARNLANLGIDIALAPLRDHPFNRAKSAIKWLEYSACRASGVYADLPAYRDVVRDGENGFLAGASPEEWFERLDRLVRDPELRRKMSDTAHDEAWSLHALDPATSPLVRALRTIRSEHATSAAPRAPKVTIVIPVHGNLDLTRDCVAALRRTTDPATTEIVVVDDASPDGTAAWLREREAAGELEAVLLPANRGFAHACNTGAAKARGTTLVFLNNDTLPEPGWLEALVAVLSKNPAVGMVGARLLYPDRTIQHAGIHFHPSGMPFHVHRGAAADDPSVLREAAFPAVTGACIAMPADLYRRLGGFDESYRMYVEDIDLCLKVWEAGREVRYCPDSVVVHMESASSTDLERRDEMVRAGLGKLHATWSGRWPQALRMVEGFPASFFGETAISPARVQWISPVWDPSGYADESRAFLKHLARTDLVVSARPWGRHSETFHQAASAADRSILDAALSREALPGSPVVLDIPAHAMGRLPGAGHHVGRTTFETDGLPSEWVARCNAMDEIWVPCAFNRETFAKAGVTKPILVVPEGVDTSKFRPGLAPLDLPGPRKAVTYLAVFEWTHRKAPDLLIQAWATAFTSADDVRLVLRTYPPNQIEGDPIAWVESRIDEELARVGKRRADCAPISAIARQVPDADMPGLYAAADVYLAPSRGEGWGRPHMEAMSCGLPVVATRWSGNLDFQTDDNSWLIEIDGLEEIDAREEFPFYRGQKWAKPSLADFVRILRISRDDQDLRRAKGERARRDMMQKWDWSKIAPLAETRIREILEGVPAERSSLLARSAIRQDVSPRNPSPSSRSIPGSSAPIRWAGPVFNYSGYARLARETLKGLMDAGVPVSCDPQLSDNAFFASLSGKNAEISRWKSLL